MKIDNCRRCHKAHTFIIAYDERYVGYGCRCLTVRVMNKDEFTKIHKRYDEAMAKEGFKL